MSLTTLGESIPQDTDHAVSVSLPTWQSNVGYEEGEDWVINRMVTGYPRFFIHKRVSALAKAIVSNYHSQDGEPRQAMLFSTTRAASRCAEFIRSQADHSSSGVLKILHFGLDISKPSSPVLQQLSPTISAVIMSPDVYPVAKQYWQHAGDGASSRRAQFCHQLLEEGLLVTVEGSAYPKTPSTRGPRRYQKSKSIDETAVFSPHVQGKGEPKEEPQESFQFLEERFGRNLDLSLVDRAKSAIRRRIAGSVAPDINTIESNMNSLSLNSRGSNSLREDDIYLFPTGMNAIFNAHRSLLEAFGPLRSINFGFPYVDTLKILQKFGPGCVFYGYASAGELDELEAALKGGERFLALFCEFPGNPLLISPDLRRIRQLADEYGFAVVVDETIGTFANINVLAAADIVVSSLTKIFSGDSNVMGGSAILNPDSKHYSSLKKSMDCIYEDSYWAEDVIFMERNSRDFLTRVCRINANAEAICDVLLGHRLVKQVFYPKHNSSRTNYDLFRVKDAGYGGLLSVVLHNKYQAKVFYDEMNIAKGPSLGTNFTLCSPYVILAHYSELAWAAQFGVNADLIRVSVGLEDKKWLEETFRKALDAAEAAPLPQDNGAS